MFEHHYDVPTAGDRVRVAVEPGLITQLGTLVRSTWPGSDVLLVTDTNVQSHHAPAAVEALQAAGLRVAVEVIEAGEASKQLASAQRLYDALGRAGIARDGLILALGGGVVSDLAGFVAATWMRGLAWAVCPTTLEADIDAALGGKTAVDLPGGKNLVGAFHQPRLVAIDPLCLQTLGDRDLRAGLAESIKHALITEAAFLAWHEDHLAGILRRDPAALAELIKRNVRIKADIVAADARERTGRRILLNFGHTVGHAIEEACGYRLRHGECAGLGMLAACAMSTELGLLSAEVRPRLEQLLRRAGLPTRFDEPVDAQRIVELTRADKKVRSGRVQFVLLRDIGEPVVRDDVPDATVEAAYRSLQA